MNRASRFMRSTGVRPTQMAVSTIAQSVGRLTAVVTDYAKRDLAYCPEFYVRPTSRTILLIEGSYTSIAGALARCRRCRRAYQAFRSALFVPDPEQQFCSDCDCRRNEPDPTVDGGWPGQSPWKSSPIDARSSLNPIFHLSSDRNESAGMYVPALIRISLTSAFIAGAIPPLLQR